MSRRALALAAVVLSLGFLLRLSVSRSFTFLGSDSYVYLSLAREWTAEHRFALGPAPEPPHWYRRPLYPAFLALVAVDHAAPASPPRFAALKAAQSLLDLFVTALLAFVCARRLAGPTAGLVALGLAALCPFTVPYTSAVLTESLAAALTLCAVAPLLLGGDRPFRWFPLGAAAVALGALTRPEGILLALAFIPAIDFLPGGARRRWALAGACLAAFALVYAPWPLRNLRATGSMHLADGFTDHTGHVVPHHQGYWEWLRSWARDARPFESLQSCYFEPSCPSTIVQYDALEAFSVEPDQRPQVEALLDLRRREGVTAAVDDGFAALARERRAHHPWKTRVGLPLRRAFTLWTGAQDELFRDPDWRPWPRASRLLLPAFPFLQALLLVFALGGVAALFSRRATRAAAWILVTALATRTAMLAWSGFCLPRYLQPVFGLLFVLAGVGAVEGVRFVRARVPRRTAA
jgi:hypothetical protein